jgi:hypothetical protein
MAALAGEKLRTIPIKVAAATNALMIIEISN